MRATMASMSSFPADDDSRRDGRRSPAGRAVERARRAALAPSGRVSLVLLLTGYVVVRACAFLNLEVAQFSDSAVFLSMVGHAPWARGLLAGPRPPVVPLLYTLAGVDGPGGVLGLQWALATVAWAALACTAARVLLPRGLRPAGCAILLAFGCATPVALWDGCLLGESVSLSLFALAAAAGLLLCNRFTTLRAALFGAAAVLWALAREPAPMELALLAVGLALAAVIRRPRSRALLILAGCLAAGAVAGFASSAAGARWEYPLADVFLQRVLPDPERASFFEARGMPASPALRALTGREANAGDWALWRSDELAGFRAWFRDRGARTYAIWLLRHPWFAAGAPLGDTGEMLAPSYDAYKPRGFSPPLGSTLDGLVYPARRSGLLLLGAAAVALAAPKRRLLATRRELLVPAAMVALAVAAAFVVWHADTIELGRHALAIAVRLRLAAWLLFLAAVGAWLPAAADGRPEAARDVP